MLRTGGIRVLPMPLTHGPFDILYVYVIRMCVLTTKMSARFSKEKVACVFYLTPLFSGRLMRW